MAEIVLIHGAWVTTASWDDFRRPLEQAGHVVHTPTWPFLAGRTAAEINAVPPKGLGGLTVGKIADHLQPQIPDGAILLGHSFGGLLTQILLDRGVGRAGIAINPVPIGGIVPGPTSVGAIVPIVTRWNGWNHPYGFTRDRWFRRFANGATRAQSDSAYDSFVIPAPGRIFYQAASGIGTHIDPKRRTQPLLITGSDKDRLVTPYVSRSAYRVQRRSAARTDYLDLGPRSHFLLNEPGWEEIADRTLAWVRGLPGK
jgi:pimeloyl-ACP methyl ester carboxylesterase